MGNCRPSQSESERANEPPPRVPAITTRGLPVSPSAAISEVDAIVRSLGRLTSLSGEQWPLTVLVIEAGGSSEWRFAAPYLELTGRQVGLLANLDQPPRDYTRMGTRRGVADVRPLFRREAKLQSATPHMSRIRGAFCDTATDLNLAERPKRCWIGGALQQRAWLF